MSEERDKAKQKKWRKLAGAEMGQSINPLYSEGFDDGYKLGRKKGIQVACAIVDDMYGNYNLHHKMQGDCVLAKLNMIPNEKIRSNPKPENISEGVQAAHREWVPIRSVDDLPELRTRAVWLSRDGNHDTFRLLSPTESLQWFVDSYTAYLLVPEYQPEEA